MFIALSAIAIARLGASLTALLVIAGNMISGVVLDLARGEAGDAGLTAAGVAMIFAGVWLSNARGQSSTR
jgi:bacterial/archaeal transporter family-2 protein